MEWHVYPVSDCFTTAFAPKDEPSASADVLYVMNGQDIRFHPEPRELVEFVAIPEIDMFVGSREYAQTASPGEIIKLRYSGTAQEWV